MRWPWQRLGVTDDEVDLAKAEAERARLDAANFERRVDDAAARFEKTRRRNHIAESIETVIKPIRHRSAEQ